MCLWCLAIVNICGIMCSMWSISGHTGLVHHAYWCPLKWWSERFLSSRTAHYSWVGSLGNCVSQGTGDAAFHSLVSTFRFRQGSPEASAGMCHANQPGLRCQCGDLGGAQRSSDLCPSCDIFFCGGWGKEAALISPYPKCASRLTGRGNNEK